jgi:serine/threonine protein kinase
MPSTDDSDRKPTEPATPTDVGSQPTVISSGSFPSLVILEAASLEDAGFDDRYQVGIELGKGGMGEVRVCRDLRLGRTVALKTALNSGRAEESLIRFLRKARVQGQLEHPAIVPVYDSGFFLRRLGN